MLQRKDVTFFLRGSASRINTYTSQEFLKKKNFLDDISSMVKHLCRKVCVNKMFNTRLRF